MYRCTANKYCWQITTDSVVAVGRTVSFLKGAGSFGSYICPRRDKYLTHSKSPHNRALISAAQVQLFSHATIVNCESHQGSVAHGKARSVSLQWMSDVSAIFCISSQEQWNINCRVTARQESTKEILSLTEFYAQRWKLASSKMSLPLLCPPLPAK